MRGKNPEGGAALAKKLTRYILLALLLGILAGWGINAAIADGTPEATAELTRIAGYFSILTNVFLHSCSRTVAPIGGRG